MRDPARFSRIAVVNRGEPAVRFIRALRDYNQERGTGLTSVVLYTDPDRSAPFLRSADESFPLGPALHPGPAGSMISAYTDHQRVLTAIAEAECDAVWPGWGFIAEDADFVAALEARGVTFIGPSSVAMRRLGDKIAAKNLAREAGVPMAPWHVVTRDEPPEITLAAAHRIGFPLLVKASAGGGGRGIRLVAAPEALRTAISAVQDEVTRSFRAGGIYLEACVTAARHVEVQLVVGADGVGTALGIRDCSIQRRHQKVIEEAPSPIVPEAMRRELERAAVRLGELVAYRGVATVEFLVDPKRDFAHFLEVNTRLQVEHTVTEVITGVDLVEAQIDIARGLPWQRPDAPPRGHAIEVRLNAEDPEREFQPSPGLVRVFRPPLGPGLRVDSGVAEGVVIAPEFDSMIAKLIAHGRDRSQALARMARALRELEISVEDGSTNKAFLAELIEDPAVVGATADTGWLDRRMKEPPAASAKTGTFEALCVAATVIRRREIDDLVGRFYDDVHNGIPYRFEDERAPIALSLRGAEVLFEAHVIESGSGWTRWLVGPRPHSSSRPSELTSSLHDARLERVAGGGAGAHVLYLSDGLTTRRHAVLVTEGKRGISVEVDGRMHLVEVAGGGRVLAPAPALVVAVHVGEGDEVAVGQRLATLEAMKMELPVVAREAGVIRQVRCRPNEQVAAAQALFEVEGAGRDRRVEVSWDPSQRAVVRALSWLFPKGEPDPGAILALPPSERIQTVGELCKVIGLALVGWDVPAALVAQAQALLAREDAFERLSDPTPYRPLADLLGPFSDVEQLFVQELDTELGARPLTGKVAFFEACRALGPRGGAVGTASAELVDSIAQRLDKALAHHGVTSLERGPALSEALWRLACAHHRSGVRHRLANLLLRALMALAEAGLELSDSRRLELFLARTAEVARPELPALRDNARQARYLFFRRRRLPPTPTSRLSQRLAALPEVGEDARDAAIEALMSEVYGEHADIAPAPSSPGLSCRRILGQEGVRALAVVAPAALSARAVTALAPALDAMGRSTRFEVHLFVTGTVEDEVLLADVLGPLEQSLRGAALQRATRLSLSWSPDGERTRHANYVLDDGLVHEPELDDIHPERARRLELARLSEFSVTRLPTPPSLPIVAMRCRARANPKDERILVFAELAHVPVLEAAERADETAGRELEWIFAECLRVIRDAQATRDASQRYFLNRIVLHVGPVMRGPTAGLVKLARRIEGAARGHGLQKLVLQAKVEREGQIVRRIFAFAMRGRHRLEVIEDLPSAAPIRAASDFHMRAARARRLGTVYPYETVRALQGTAGADLALTPHPDMAQGRFEEHDLDPSGARLVPVARPLGQNRAGVVVGLITHVTRKHPEGMTRVWIGSDATTSMGALAEPECRRIIAALALAETLRIPVEWLPISAGAKIAMDSGTENLDWTARVLRALVEFTQRGGEVNVIVAGVNVGAQSYWNAEATMLMHTRGILIQTADGSMVLTGKRALEVSGSVSAEDERGIGGFERVMGPNGQAQYFAAHLGDAYRILFEHYAFSYVMPGEAGPRRLSTSDPATRSILAHEGAIGDGLSRLSDLFSEETNPGRKKPFAIREVMRATIDRDGGYLERFADMAGGETAAVWDAHLGGHAVTLIGFESRNIPRMDRAPLDGPDHWTGGTLFPLSSKKVARAINQASGNRPVVALANLSGFDGSPESMRKLQLEYGAEIGRAVVNFDGPIVFAVIGRYHGGAYVVFSKALNGQLTALAVDGAYASVIGGAPAAAVVFSREVRRRADHDPRVTELRAELEALPADATPEARTAKVVALERVRAGVLLEQQGILALEFDAIHSVERAVSVGSLDAVVPPEELRSRIIEVLERRRPTHTQEAS